MRRLCRREWNWQANWQSVNHIPGIHDNGPRDHGVWRLTLTAYYFHLGDRLQFCWIFGMASNVMTCAMCQILTENQLSCVFISWFYSCFVSSMLTSIPWELQIIGIETEDRIRISRDTFNKTVIKKNIEFLWGNFPLNNVVREEYRPTFNIHISVSIRNDAGYRRM